MIDQPEVRTTGYSVARSRVEGEADLAEPLTDAEMVQLLTAELAVEWEKRHAAKMARKSARDEANASTGKWIDAAKEVTRLTAEVERLRGEAKFAAGETDTLRRWLAREGAEVERLRGVVREAYHEGVNDGCLDLPNWKASDAFAALALPTNAPEATDGRVSRCCVVLLWDA